MGAALKFKHADVPRQASERARFKVVHGLDAGATYVISGMKAVIGRGEDCDIIISDLKASRRHAELNLTGNQWTVRDLGSANGIVHNGRTTRAASLRTSDTITLGETTLEFVAPEAGTSVLRAVPRSMNEVVENQVAFAAQKEKVLQLAQFGTGPKPALAPAPSSGSERGSRRILLIGAAGIIAFVLLSTGDKSPVLKSKAKGPDLVSYLPQTDTTPNKSAEQFLNAGLREYREKNYLRARTQFETVLQIDPSNSLAQLYKQNCTKAIDDEVKFHLQHGQRAYENGDLKQAKIHFETICRLLYRDQSNPAFKEAQDHAKQVYQELDMKPGPNDPENSCQVPS